MKYIMATLSVVIATTLLAQDTVQVTMTLQQAAMWNQMRNQGTNMTGASIGGIGQGCFGSMVNSVSNGMRNNFQAQTEEANMLMDIAREYYEHEMSCKNDLAQTLMEHNNAVAEHEVKLFQLPNEIEDLQIEYELAVLAVQQECEQTSGQIFQEWKTAQSTGVVTEGLAELVGRQGNINQFQRLFYDDCITSASNVQRVNLLGRRLDNNVKKLRAGMEASAEMLNTATQNMSFKQGVAAENCIDGTRMLDYKRAVAQNNANANNTMARTNNFLGAIGAVAQCIGGPSNRQGLGNPDATGSSTIQ